MTHPWLEFIHHRKINIHDNHISCKHQLFPGIIFLLLQKNVESTSLHQMLVVILIEDVDIVYTSK